MGEVKLWKADKALSKSTLEVGDIRGLPKYFSSETIEDKDSSGGKSFSLEQKTHSGSPRLYDSKTMNYGTQKNKKYNTELYYVEFYLNLVLKL